ncbi:hypothetical protein AAULR_05091 [Lacticaseibacillus rhamnosus MTCC 5462]|nr:hypothetical protein AAULR_05091 [Lacticaseibacillus rhamnosus MTCC 5462]
MNADKGIKRQQRRLFIGQLLSFAGTFSSAGGHLFSFMNVRFIKISIIRWNNKNNAYQAGTNHERCRWSRTPGDFTTSTFSDEHGGF